MAKHSTISADANANANVSEKSQPYSMSLDINRFKRKLNCCWEDTDEVKCTN